MEKIKNIAPHVTACTNCEGKGKLFNEHNGYPNEVCWVCKGSGRVKVQSRVITQVEAFVPGKDDVELLKM
ncbi:MAG: molecular chaperone DnaJ [Tannerella sp.]|jgi:DnaJ-class molecular chaperone|nr:molecular chaperone DnaJ [Tannerella sp.]